MKLCNDQRGFVLSGVALLLILPAMLLAASCLSIIGIGGEATSLQALSDKVEYTGHNIGRVIKDMVARKLPTDGPYLSALADNYRASTGLLVDIGLHPLWIYVENSKVRHYAGTKYCKVVEAGMGKWRYNFEDLDEGVGQNVDWDYDEPILLVERLDGRLRITIENYGGVYQSDIYYGNQKLWDDAGGSGRVHVGESREVDEILQPSIDNVSQLNTVIIYVRDPRGAARYSSIAKFGLYVQLDQNNPYHSNKWHEIRDSYWEAQTFVAGLTGPLTRVALYLRREGNPGELTIEIRGCAGAEEPPDNNILASMTTNSVTSTTGQEYGFTFTSPASVTAGTHYSIVLHEQAGVGGKSDNYRWAENTYPDIYPEGHVWRSYDGGGSWRMGGKWRDKYIHDFYFRTYVKADP